jgi:hypothetical protein
VALLVSIVQQKCVFPCSVAEYYAIESLKINKLVTSTTPHQTLHYNKQGHRTNIDMILGRSPTQRRSPIVIYNIGAPTRAA